MVLASVTALSTHSCPTANQRFAVLRQLQCVDAVVHIGSCTNMYHGSTQWITCLLALEAKLAAAIATPVAMAMPALRLRPCVLALPKLTAEGLACVPGAFA